MIALCYFFKILCYLQLLLFLKRQGKIYRKPQEALSHCRRQKMCTAMSTDIVYHYNQIKENEFDEKICNIL